MSDQQTPEPDRSTLPTWRDTPGARPEATAPDAVSEQTVPEDVVAEDVVPEEDVPQDVVPEADALAEDAAPEPEPEFAAVATGSEVPAVEQEWVKGPSPFTVAAGLIFVALAVLSVFKLVSDSTVDWAVALPATTIGIGLLIAAAGASTLIRRTRH